MLPPVGVLVPICLLATNAGLIDTRALLILVHALVLPIMVCMLYTFFKETLRDILEASRMDGARPGPEIRTILLPLALPGIASTGLTFSAVEMKGGAHGGRFLRRRAPRPDLRL